MHLTARGCVIALAGALGMIVLFFWVTGVNASAQAPLTQQPEAQKPPPVALAAAPATPAPAPAPTPAPTTAPRPAAKPAVGIKAALLAPATPGPTSHVKKAPAAKAKKGEAKHGKAKGTRHAKGPPKAQKRTRR